MVIHDVATVACPFNGWSKRNDNLVAVNRDLVIAVLASLKGDNNTVIPNNVTGDKSTLQLFAIIGDGGYIITLAINSDVKHCTTVVKSFQDLDTWHSSRHRRGKFNPLGCEVHAHQHADDHCSIRGTSAQVIGIDTL